MANKTLNTVIKLRYDSYENWQANSTVVLQAGEAGICTVRASTGTGLNEPATLMKIGNGTSTWAELPWISSLAADVVPSLKGSNPTLPVESVTGLDDYLASHGAIDTDTQYQIVKEGDMGIKLQSRPKSGGAWTDVTTITLTPPTYTLDEGSTNGTVAFNGEDVAVHGLGSAAYTESSAYDAAGAASAVQTALIGTAQDASSANTINAAKKFATESIDTAIGTLNLNAVTAGTGQVIGEVKQTDGAVTAQVKTLTADDIPEIPQSKVTNLTTTLAGKQDTIVFNTTYDPASNKASTMADITSSVNTAKTELIGTPDDASSLNTINAAKKYASEQIAAQIGSAYKAAGSTAFADLPTPEEAIEGYVYNVTDAFTADTKFITSEQSKQYPAGTNVVVVEVPGEEEAPSTYAYDVLTGMVDLSAYATTSAMNSAIGAAKTELIGTGNTTASTIKGAGDEVKAYADTLNTAMDTRVEALETAVGETPVATQITNAIQALDHDDTAVPGQVVVAVDTQNGISVPERRALSAGDIPNLTASKITDLESTVETIVETAMADSDSPENPIKEAIDTAVNDKITEAVGDGGAVDTAIDNAISTAVGDGGAVDTAIDNKIDEELANSGKIDTAIDTAVSTAIQGLDSTASAEGSAVVSGVTLTDGVVSVASKTLGISDITDLTTTLAGKADTSSLGYFAHGTDATHLTLDSGNYLILNGGGAAGF